LLRDAPKALKVVLGHSFVLAVAVLLGTLVFKEGLLLLPILVISERLTRRLLIALPLTRLLFLGTLDWR